MIGVIDYGAGNLRSVQNMLDSLDVVSTRVQTPEDLRNLDGLILPGVGAFGAAMERMEQNGLADAVGLWLESDLPLLGICLGLQLLFEGSAESPGVTGFGRFTGNCRRVRGRIVPHIGWNRVSPQTDDPLLANIGDDNWFYFLHSYQAPDSTDGTTAVTDYAGTFPSMLVAGNCRAVQFHPEKSGETGAKLLKNWVTSCCR